jgi:hypothetical protein
MNHAVLRDPSIMRILLLCCGLLLRLVNLLNVVVYVIFWGLEPSLRTPKHTTAAASIGKQLDWIERLPLPGRFHL